MLFIILFQLVLSEIMSNPIGREYDNEFVEIYNNLNTAIDLTHYSISDGDKRDGILIYKGSPILGPGEYGIVLDPSYFGSDEIYSDLITKSEHVFIIDNGSFGSRGFSNSVSELVSLYKGDILIDSVWIDINGEEGRSYERRVSYSSEWMFSETINGSPGFKNTIDHEIDFLKLNNPKIYNKEIILEFVNNTLFQQSSKYLYQITDFSTIDNTIVYMDSFKVNIEQNFAQTIKINYSKYINKDISQIRFVLKNHVSDTIINLPITEIKPVSYFPLILTYIVVDKPQIMKFMNISNQSFYIDTLGFKVKTSVKKIPVHQYINPNSDLIFSKHDPLINGVYDENIPYLYSKNMAVEFVLFGLRDSVQYEIDPNDFNTDYMSLIPEKLNQYNYLSDWIINPDISQSPIIIDKEKFQVTNSPVNLNIEPALFNLEYRKYDIIDLEIYNMAGRKIRKIVNQSYFAYGQHQWDGKDEYNRIVDSGVYIFYLRARNKLSGKIKKIKHAFIVYK